ncbi:unnamed protein product [Ambrosiozyma monospora]|uniref:Unnamed protein product n=1 Tax=Ambrosiozyma monospora TaxID=43982 RepID=A0A9W6Z5L8_AMBMO|nr:unnamed protein product [Ambrosiozyma monospora]
MMNNESDSDVESSSLDSQVGVRRSSVLITPPQQQQQQQQNQSSVLSHSQQWKLQNSIHRHTDATWQDPDFQLPESSYGIQEQNSSRLTSNIPSAIKSASNRQHNPSSADITSSKYDSNSPVVPVSTSSFSVSPTARCKSTPAAFLLTPEITEAGRAPNTPTFASSSMKSSLPRLRRKPGNIAQLDMTLTQGSTRQPTVVYKSGKTSPSPIINKGLTSTQTVSPTELSTGRPSDESGCHLSNDNSKIRD